MIFTATCAWLCLLVAVASGDSDSVRDGRDGREIEARIVGGTPTTADQYPYIVSLHSTVYMHYCGGSLLRLEDPAIVLTAAHCVDDITDNDVSDNFVDIGRTDIDDYHETGFVTRTFKAVKYHADYNSNTLANDIALVVLDGAVDSYRFESVDLEYYTPCCYDNQELRAIGYGHDESGGYYTDTLEYVDVDFISNSQCESIFDSSHGDYSWDYIEDGMMCAHEHQKDTCQADSGGPLVIPNTNTQVGVVSWGYGCADSTPGVYADIGWYHDWIRAVEACLVLEHGGDSDADTVAYLQSWCDWLQYEETTQARSEGRSDGDDGDDGDGGEGTNAEDWTSLWAKLGELLYAAARGLNN